jgi:hypothetical protein
MIESAVAPRSTVMPARLSSGREIGYPQIGSGIGVALLGLAAAALRPPRRVARRPSTCAHAADRGRQLRICRTIDQHIGRHLPHAWPQRGEDLPPSDFGYHLPFPCRGALPRQKSTAERVRSVPLDEGEGLACDSTLSRSWVINRCPRIEPFSSAFFSESRPPPHYRGQKLAIGLLLLTRQCAHTNAE